MCPRRSTHLARLTHRRASYMRGRRTRCQTPDPRVLTLSGQYQHIEIVAGFCSKGLISAQTGCTLSRHAILPNHIDRRRHRLLWNFEQRLMLRREKSMLEVAVRVARPDVCCLCCAVVCGSWARLLLAGTVLDIVLLRLPEAECMRLHVQGWFRPACSHYFLLATISYLVLFMIISSLCSIDSRVRIVD